jgi:hypothetical protein
VQPISGPSPVIGKHTNDDLDAVEHGYTGNRIAAGIALRFS